MTPIAEMAGKILKDYGLPTLIALALWYSLNGEMKRNREAMDAQLRASQTERVNQMKDAADERTTLTAILIDQMSDLRLACKPK
jgi:hypothetical protein